MGGNLLDYMIQGLIKSVTQHGMVHCPYTRVREAEQALKRKSIDGAKDSGHSQ
jgi:hypothetical protein